MSIAQFIEVIIRELTVSVTKKTNFGGCHRPYTDPYFRPDGVLFLFAIIEMEKLHKSTPILC